MCKFFLISFLRYCLPGVVEEHTLDRDGPISNVKLYSQSSSASKSSNGKTILLILVLLVKQLNLKQNNHILSVTDQARENRKVELF